MTIYYIKWFQQVQQYNKIKKNKITFQIKQQNI